MSEELKYIEVITWNRKMMLLYGDKLTWTQRAIGLRSNGVHTSLRYTDRYGRICYSCTLADGVGGCRFKMLELTHPYRQSRIRIPVTAEQEAKLFKKACEMAGRSVLMIESFMEDEKAGYNDDNYTYYPVHEGIYYGPNHIKYDIWGARLSFITKWNIWKMHRVKMICNEAVATVLLRVWPDLLTVRGVAKDPATLTPDQFHYLVEYYFYQKGQ